MNGFILINKPEGPTSFDVVKITRKACGVKKIGHSGTLDPFATGLLILALGRATRVLPFLPSEPKTYYFTVQFGQTTDTLDKTGRLHELAKPLPSKQTIQNSLLQFLGIILQKPPKYSALKIHGQRAYRLARQNKIFDIPERKINIFSLALLKYNEKAGIADFKVRCSSGTYVRSLARDIAESCDTFGYVLSIHRTRIDRITIREAISLDTVQKNGLQNLIPIARMFHSFPSFIATPSQVTDLVRGKDIEIDRSESTPELFIYSSQNELISIAERKQNNVYHPKKVFLSHENYTEHFDTP